MTSNQSSTKKTLNVRQQQPQTVEGSNNKNVKENSKDDKTSANGNSGVTRCDWHAREEDKNGKFIPEGKICKFINSLWFISIASSSVFLCLVSRSGLTTLSASFPSLGLCNHDRKKIKKYNNLTASDSLSPKQRGWIQGIQMWKARETDGWVIWLWRSWSMKKELTCHHSLQSVMDALNPSQLPSRSMCRELIPNVTPSPPFIVRGSR